ncbi:MAG: trehalase family glycosidase [Deinococcales bacterium]
MSLREIAPRYQLNTWLSDTPATVLDAVSGLYVAPVAFSASAHASSRLDDPERTRLGPRRLDGSHIELEFEHAGSTFRLCYAKPTPTLLRAELRPVQLGEWGLRTWLCLLVGFHPGIERPGERRLPRASADGTVTAEARERALALVPDTPPVFVTLHDSTEALEDDLTERGYYADAIALRKGDPPAAAPVVALRFNMEATPVVRFVVAIGADVGRALARAARPTLAEPTAAATAEAAPEPSAHGGSWLAGDHQPPPSDADEALDAIETVLGWNSILDSDNQRWYTAPTRSWVSRKFGGWFTWLDDTFFHAHLAAAVDPEAARRNLEVALSSATPEGNLACLVSPRTAWLDRSQSPVGALVLWSTYLRTGDRSTLARALPTLLSAFDWWLRERRDERTGLFAFGTSDYGHGAFQGTALAARDESFMDNSPMHDGVELDPATGRLRQLDVGLSSLVALEAELLSKVAAHLGDTVAAERLAVERRRIAAAIDTHLWHEEAGAYVNVAEDGTPSPRIGPTSFYPLLAGVPSAERAERTVKAQLLDERGFWGSNVLPTIRRDDPAFVDNVYWRGRIWPPTNYLVYLGLRRYRFAEAARAVADRSFAMFAAEWREHGHCHENYNAVTGEGHDSKDSDPFYGWGGLMPMMRLEEAIFPSPWEGLTVVPERGPCARGTLWRGRRVGLLQVGGAPAGWRVTLDGRSVLEGDAACRLSGLEVGGTGLEARVESARGVALTVPGLRREQTLHAALPDGATLEDGSAGVRLRVPAGRHALRLALTRGWDTAETGRGTDPAGDADQARPEEGA